MIIVDFFGDIYYPSRKPDSIENLLKKKGIKYKIMRERNVK